MKISDQRISLKGYSYTIPPLLTVRHNFRFNVSIKFLISKKMIPAVRKNFNFSNVIRTISENK